MSWEIVIDQVPENHWVPEIRFSDTYLKSDEKWVLKGKLNCELNEDFQSFALPSTCSTLKNHRIWRQKFGEN